MSLDQAILTVLPEGAYGQVYLVSVERFARLKAAEFERDTLKDYVRGIIPFLERHLQEILEVKDTPPDLKPAIRVGYLDCLGTLKDALFEAGLVNGEVEE